MGVCGLSLMGLHDLHPVAPDLNISIRAKAHMKNLHLKWDQLRAKREEALNSGRVKLKSTSSVDRTHIGTVFLAFIIGLGAVVLPWVYSVYFSS